MGALVVLVMLGCGGGDDYVYEPTCDDPLPAFTGPTPTWSADVQPIVARSCLGCHGEGGVAPIPLTTFAEAAPWAEAIAHDTEARLMPPWPPTSCGECGTWRDARTLTDEEIVLLGAWAAAGAPEGDATVPPAEPAPLPHLERVDARIELGVDYTPDADLADDYRCFLADPGLIADRYLVGFEVHPGEEREVHHVVVGAIDTAEAEQAAAALDQDHEGPGWSCYGGFGVADTRMIAAHAPGSGAKRFPDGTGIRLAAGRKLIVQMHYNSAQGVFPDRTAVELMLEEQVERPAEIEIRNQAELRLPPGRPEVSETFTFDLGAGTLYGIAPHQHQIGRTIKAELVHADGSTTCLVDVPVWDFHWQGLYFYEDPVEVAAGDRLRVHCVWDTTSVDRVVEYGEGSADEMCVVLTYGAFEGGD